MTIVLDHLIVPATDRYRAAAFLASLLGLTVGQDDGPFTPLRLNPSLTFDFDERATVVAGHYAFLVDEAHFAMLAARLAADSSAVFGAGPETGWNRGFAERDGGRAVYVQDPDGHGYEFFTVRP